MRSGTRNAVARVVAWAVGTCIVGMLGGVLGVVSVYALVELSDLIWETRPPLWIEWWGLLALSVVAAVGGLLVWPTLIIQIAARRLREARDE